MRNHSHAFFNNDVTESLHQCQHGNSDGVKTIFTFLFPQSRKQISDQQTPREKICLVVAVWINTNDEKLNHSVITDGFQISTDNGVQFKLI